MRSTIQDLSARTGIVRIVPESRAIRTRTKRAADGKGYTRALTTTAVDSLGSPTLDRRQKLMHLAVVDEYALASAWLIRVA